MRLLDATGLSHAAYGLCSRISSTGLFQPQSRSFISIRAVADKMIKSPKLARADLVVYYLDGKMDLEFGKSAR